MNLPNILRTNWFCQTSGRESNQLFQVELCLITSRWSATCSTSQLVGRSKGKLWLTRFNQRFTHSVGTVAGRPKSILASHPSLSCTRTLEAIVCSQESYLPGLVQPDEYPFLRQGIPSLTNSQHASTIVVLRNSIIVLSKRSCRSSGLGGVDSGQFDELRTIESVAGQALKRCTRGVTSAFLPLSTTMSLFQSSDMDTLIFQLLLKLSSAKELVAKVCLFMTDSIY